jgi:lipoprotein-anchoring transpeptidase ErfK/SrfK
MTKLAIPTGPIDGDFGGQTARGLCTFRLIKGMKPSRATVNTGLLTEMAKFSTDYGTIAKAPAPTKDGQRTYVLVNETCQILLYVENGKYVRAIPVSTGKKGHGTPNTTETRKFKLGYTEKGWKCSSKYPDNPDGTCTKHTEGRFATSTSSGNMYNRRLITGDYFIHGSTSVPTYPDSHGCIRVPVSVSDWMYDKVGNGARPALFIEGDYYKG